MQHNNQILGGHLQIEYYTAQASSCIETTTQPLNGPQHCSLSSGRTIIGHCLQGVHLGESGVLWLGFEPMTSCASCIVTTTQPLSQLSG